MTPKVASRWLPTPRAAVVVIGLYVVGMLTALALGAFEPWFLGIGPRGGQGTDFFCVPKAYLNLYDGRSAFDTWSAPRFGPYATWFVLHPAVAIWVGGYLAWLPPWFAYGTFVVATLGLLATSAALVAYHAKTPWQKVFVYGALLASPVTYSLLFVGNVHGLVVLAATLLLVGVFELMELAHVELPSTDSPDYKPAFGIAPTTKVLCGLLLSLLSKPVLGLLVPALLLVRRSRRPTLLGVGAYAAISAAFLWCPYLNPEPIGTQRLVELALSPAWVKEHLNIYVNQFRLTPEMRDNAMHWLHMVAQSGFLWDHAQILSLPVFVKGLLGASPPLQGLALLPVVLAPGLLFVRKESERIRSLAWLVILALASHFLSYSIAWEYQYTQLLLVTAALVGLPLLERRDPRWVLPLSLVALLTLQIPSPYAWIASGGLEPQELAWLRAFRLFPAVVMATTACWVVIGAVIRGRRSR